MPAPSVIRAERSLHPQRREPGWLETPCPERGSCRTVGDPRLRQLAADTGDHATGRSAARFAPPWEIPRGGANRRSVDRFIPRLWGNIGPAWSPSMSIPAHPHARGEHQAASAAATIDDGSSPHPWGTRRAPGQGQGIPRFIPTPVGNTEASPERTLEQPVHPHTRGEHKSALNVLPFMNGSSPHPWGTQQHDITIERHGRFIPTPVGNTRTPPTTPSTPTVHPHTRGEHHWPRLPPSLFAGSSPHPWGTRSHPPQPPRRRRFIPTPVGNTTSSNPSRRATTVHPHTRGEHRSWSTSWEMNAGSSPHPWGTQVRGLSLSHVRRFIPTPVGNTLTVSHCFKKRKTTAKFYRAKRPSRRSWK